MADKKYEPWKKSEELLAEANQLLLEEKKYFEKRVEGVKETIVSEYRETVSQFDRKFGELENRLVVLESENQKLREIEKHSKIYNKASGFFKGIGRKLKREKWEIKYGTLGHQECLEPDYLILKDQGKAPEKQAPLKPEDRIGYKKGSKLGKKWEKWEKKRAKRAKKEERKRTKKGWKRKLGKAAGIVALVGGIAAVGTY